MVAAHDRRDEAAVAGDEEGGLRRPILTDPEERRERRDRGRPGRRDLLPRQGLLGGGLGAGRPRDLAVCRVPARVAQDEDVLAGGVEDHELVGLAAAHDPDVARDDLRLEPEPLEDPDVGALLRLVAHVEAGLVAVAAVGVLHDELADADEAAPGPWLVAPLRLEVVEHHRQLAVGLDDVREEQPDDLLVGHREDHVALVAILEPRQLRPDRLVTAARLPDIGRMDDGHLELLAADPIHLLADDLLDALVDPEPERQQRVDPRPELADVAGPDEEPVRGHLGVGRVVAQRREEELAKTHGGKDSRRVAC